MPPAHHVARRRDGGKKQRETHTQHRRADHSQCDIEKEGKIDQSLQNRVAATAVGHNKSTNKKANDRRHFAHGGTLFWLSSLCVTTSLAPQIA